MSVKNIMESENKVILICVRPYYGFEKDISDESLKRIFENFGTVKATQIFERTSLLVKAFIEFTEISVSKHILQNYIGISTTFATFKIFSSKKKYLVRNVPMRNPNPRKRKRNQNRQAESEFDVICESLESQSEGSNEKNPKLISENFWKKTQKVKFWDTNLKVPAIGLSDENQSGNKVSRQTKIGFSKFEKDQKLKQNLLQDQNSTSQTFHWIMKVDRNSFKDIHVKQLLNVFGYFGNIVAITVVSFQNFVLVHYKNLQSLKLAEKGLKNVEFFGEAFRITVLDQSLMTDDFVSSLSNKQVFKVSKSLSFKKMKALTEFATYTPSNFIIVEKLPISVGCYLMEIIFSEIHRPMSITKISEDVRSATQVIVIELKEVYQAIELLARMQSQKVDDKKLKLSFTKTCGIKQQEFR